MSRNYTTESNTFVFRRAWGFLFTYLTDEDAGRLIKAVFAHADGKSAKEYLQGKENLKPLAESIICELEMNAKRYLRKTGRLSERERKPLKTVTAAEASETSREAAASEADSLPEEGTGALREEYTQSDAVPGAYPGEDFTE